MLGFPWCWLVESCVIPLKPKNGLNGAPNLCCWYEEWPRRDNLELAMYRQQTVGAPFKPFFGLSGITQLSTSQHHGTNRFCLACVLSNAFSKLRRPAARSIAACEIPFPSFKSPSGVYKGRRLLIRSGKQLMTGILLPSARPPFIQL
jgi:hypothetical protein